MNYYAGLDVSSGPPADVACTLALWIGHDRWPFGLSMGDASPSGSTPDWSCGYDFP